MPVYIGGIVVCQLAHVTNTILNKAKVERVPISQMKLQKLLYFLYKEYIQETGKPLFPERFEPWEYGPVISEVYYAFKDSGSKSLTRYLPDAEGKYQMINCDDNTEFGRIFNSVWNRYKNYSGIELSKLSHSQGGAWRKAVFNNNIFLTDSDIQNEPIYQVQR